MEGEGNRDSASSRKRQKVGDADAGGHSGRKLWRGNSWEPQADSAYRSHPASEGKAFTRGDSYGAHGGAYGYDQGVGYDADRRYGGGAQEYPDWRASRSSSGWYEGYSDSAAYGASSGYGAYPSHGADAYAAEAPLSRAYSASDAYGYDGFYRSNSVERDRAAPSSSSYYHDEYAGRYSYTYDSYRSAYADTTAYDADGTAARSAYRSSRFGLSSPFRGGASTAAGAKSTAGGGRYANTFQARQYSFGAKKNNVNGKTAASKAGNGTGDAKSAGKKVEEKKEEEKPRVITDNAVKDLLALRTAMLDYHVITALLKLSLKPDPDLRKTLLEQKLAAQEAERKAQMEVEAKAAADLAAAAAAEEEARRKEVQAAAAKEAEERRAARAATAAAAAAAATAAAAAATASVQKADDGAAEAGARNVNVTPDRSGPRKREVSKAVSGKESRPQIEAAESLRSPSISRQSSAGGGIIAEEAKRDVGGGDRKRDDSAARKERAARRFEEQVPPALSRESTGNVGGNSTTRPGSERKQPAPGAGGDAGPRSGAADGARGRSPSRGAPGAISRSASDVGKAAPVPAQRSRTDPAARSRSRDPRGGYDYAYPDYPAGGDHRYAGHDDRYAYDAYSQQAYYDQGYGADGYGYPAAGYHAGYGAYDQGYGQYPAYDAQYPSGDRYGDAYYSGRGEEASRGGGALLRQGSTGSARGRSRSPGKAAAAVSAPGGLSRSTSAVNDRAGDAPGGFAQGMSRSSSQVQMAAAAPVREAGEAEESSPPPNLSRGNSYSGGRDAQTWNKGFQGKGQHQQHGQRQGQGGQGQQQQHQGRQQGHGPGQQQQARQPGQGQGQGPRAGVPNEAAPLRTPR